MTSTSRGLAGTLLPIDLLLIAMALIQSDASLARSMLPLVDAQGTTTLWLFFVALTLLLLLRPQCKRLSLQSLRSVVVYGIALDGVNLLSYLSVCTVSLGIAAALEFTGPLLVAILPPRRLLDFPQVDLAVFSIWLLLPLSNSAEPLDLVNAAYAFNAGVCWALYTLFGQRTDANHGAQGAALGMLVAAILVVPTGVAHIGADPLDLALVPLTLGVAALSMALPCILEIVALTRLPARTFGTLMSIEPAFGALSGSLFLGERLNPIQWPAISATALASVGTTFNVKLHGVASTPPTKD